MNTDPQNQERVQGLQLHPEQSVPNTNPRKHYQVTVARIDYLYTRIRVEAESEDAAETMAEQLAQVQEELRWDCADRDLYALEVEEVKEGKSHE